jgi:hypothetical protein
METERGTLPTFLAVVLQSTVRLRHRAMSVSRTSAATATL